MQTYILGIETSCDDTSVAVVRDNVMLSNIIAGQEVHRTFGGVVPELASRAHQQNIIPVVEAALKKAGIDKKQLNAIAYTNGPGLLGSLLVGVSFAKAFALGLGVPLIEVDHLQAHVLCHFLHREGKHQPEFPFLCLTVSGGHTRLDIVNDYFSFDTIGNTIDDAAGETFDKVAKILGLPYPGGPAVDKCAASGNADAFKFPVPKAEGYNLSFSGLKTSFLYLIRDALKKDTTFIETHLNDLCASVQKTIIDALMHKLIKAASGSGIQRIALSGGVSANSALRQRLLNEGEKRKWQVFIPDLQFTTDNAAMVAIAGYFKYKQNMLGTHKALPYARQSQKK